MTGWRQAFCRPTPWCRRLVAALVGVLAMTAKPVPGQTLGRLFSTMEERAALDDLRTGQAHEKPIKKRQIPPVEYITINGIVLRSSGNNASWINGRRILDNGLTHDGIRVEPSDESGGTVRIYLPNGTDTLQLKPGQTIDVRMGTVLDAYQWGSK